MNKYAFLVAFFTLNLAFSFCKLNISGDNICLNERAVEILYDKDSDTKSFNLVTIKDIKFPDITVNVDGEQGTKVVHIDDLSGNLTCEESITVCKSEKVIVDHECIDKNRDKEIKVENVFSNDLVEIKTGFIFFKKSELVPVSCILSIN